MKKHLMKLAVLSFVGLATLFPANGFAQETQSIVTFTNYVNGTAQIYQMDPDGTNIHPLRSNTYWESQAVVSPDGSKIAFVSNMDGDYDVYVMNADGSDLKNISNNNDYDYSPSWSGDGKKLAYLTSSDGLNTAEIVIVEEDGSNPVKVPNFKRNCKHATLSPNGEKIALSVGPNGELAVINTDGTGYRNFKEELIGNWVNVHSPDWSKDSSKILFSYETSSIDVPGWEGDVMVATVNPDGTNYQELYRGNKVLEIGSARYSPDENEIMFSQSVPGPNYISDWEYSRQLFKLKVNENNIEQITTLPVFVEDLNDWK